MRVEGLTATIATHASANTVASAAPAHRAPAMMVPLERTRATPAEIRSALDAAHRELTGHAAPAPLLDVLTAHVSHETGRGSRMYNFNFGGIKGTGPSGLSASSMTREVVSGANVHVRDRFRAYGSMEEGAADYMGLIQHRFGAAYSAASRGDVDGFAHELHRAGYFTEPEQAYAGSLRSLAGLPPRAPSGLDALDAPASRDTVAGFSTDGDLGRVMDALSSSASTLASPTSDDDDNHKA